MQGPHEITIPYGLGVLPKHIRQDDARLPTVRLGNLPLRLNTMPLPMKVTTSYPADHAARVTAVRQWLISQCGQYVPRCITFIDSYLAYIANCLQRDRALLQEKLARYDGLYAVEDWTWSALRPLPRAWLPTENETERVDFAFWDGSRLIRFDLNRRDIADSVSDAELSTPDTLFPSRLPQCTAWQNEILPSSPFRRSMERPVVFANQPANEANP